MDWSFFKCTVNKINNAKFVKFKNLMTNLPGLIVSES